MFYAGETPSKAFLVKRIVDFIYESFWPDALRLEFNTSEEYAFDLSKRAAWKRAALSSPRLMFWVLCMSKEASASSLPLWVHRHWSACSQARW